MYEGVSHGFGGAQLELFRKGENSVPGSLMSSDHLLLLTATYRGLC